MSVLANLSRYPIVATDTETMGLRWYRDKMFGIALAAWDGERVVAEYHDIRENPKVIDVLRRELPKCKRIVNHNMKFDCHFMMNENIAVPLDRLECTSVRAALINEHESSFSLDALAKKYLGRHKIDIYSELAQLFGGKSTRDAQMPNLHRAPVALAAKYATVDPELAILLWLWQEDEIKRQGLAKVWDLERRLMPVLIKMERHGVRTDIEFTEKSRTKIDKIVASTQRELNKTIGHELNTASPKQMRELFQPKKGDDGRWRIGKVLLTTTEAGAPSLNADALRNLTAAGHPIAAKILQIRKLNKGLSFLKDHILAHHIKGRVYPNYNQTRGDNELGTGTGRFSINDPALQQIPARDVEVASIVRACFIADNIESEWCCSDWEQFEFRWFAHYAQNPKILKAYQDNPDIDFHQTVADQTGLHRSPHYAGDPNAKQINLGLVFGMGEGRMASEMGLDYHVEQQLNAEGEVVKEWLKAGPQAAAIFEQYHEAVPGVKSLLQKASSIARSRGYVRTVMGRHIRFPGGRFTHKAGGLTFQGTSADCMKVKMIEMQPICEEYGFSMLLSVHDELDFSVPKPLKVEAARIIKYHLEAFDGEICEIGCRVPIRASVGFGSNWWKASKGE